MGLLASSGGNPGQPRSTRLLTTPVLRSHSPRWACRHITFDSCPSNQCTGYSLCWNSPFPIAKLQTGGGHLSTLTQGSPTGSFRPLQTICIPGLRSVCDPSFSPSTSPPPPLSGKEVRRLAHLLPWAPTAHRPSVHAPACLGYSNICCPCHDAFTKGGEGGPSL